MKLLLNHLKKIYLFCVYECFAYVYACVPPICLTSMDVRRGCWIPLELELQMLVRGHMGTGNPGPLQKLHVLSAAETFFQPPWEVFYSFTEYPQ